MEKKNTVLSLDDLTAMTAAIINTNSSEAHLRPQWVADQVMKQTDPLGVSLPAVYGGCNRWLRQVARQILRQKFEVEEGDQHSLFPELQWRYPIERAKGQEPDYVLLELMTAFDIIYNVNRLASESVAKQKHSDALLAYGKDKFHVLRSPAEYAPAR